MAEEQEVKTLTAETLSGGQKAAILLIALGPEISTEVYKHMGEAQIRQLTREIAGLRQVTKDIREAVFEEFYQKAMGLDYIKGSSEDALDFLKRTFGDEKAAEFMEEVKTAEDGGPGLFDFLKNLGTDFLYEEHPQVAALVLSHMTPEWVSSIVSAAPPAFQADVPERMATMGEVMPDVIKEIRDLLRKKMSSATKKEATSKNRLSFLAKMVEGDGGDRVLEGLRQKNPKLAEEVRGLVFLFEDVVTIEDESLQLALGKVGVEDLVMALKGATKEIKDKIFKNVSGRLRSILNEELEYKKESRKADVDKAQRKLVNILRELDKSGDIILKKTETV